MTPAEADRIVKILSAAWGYFADDTTGRVALWTEHLERLEFEPTCTAARKLAETCDGLPSLAAFLRAAHDEERFARLAASAPTLRPGEDSYACSCGENRGWMIVSHGNPPDVRPCERCRPVTHEQWGDGHYGPDHDRARCGECRRHGRAA